jgi:ribosomal silencing factor RsfS
VSGGAGRTCTAKHQRARGRIRLVPNRDYSMNKKSKILAVVGVAIGVTSYFCKEGIDAIERTKSSLETELASHRASLTEQTTQMQIIQSKQELENLMRENSHKDSKKSANLSHATTILQDTLATRQAQAMVQVDIDGLSRLIDKLAVWSANPREQLDKIKTEIAKTDRQTNDTLKPSSEDSWERAVQVKLAFVITFLNMLPVDFLGDAVINQAKGQVKILDFLVTFGRWVVRILFVVGACFTLYGIFTGVKLREATN